MIVKKTLEINTKNMDSVVLELADEIKAGWTIKSIIPSDKTFECQCCWQPTFEVVLVRKNGGD